jgi:thymidylate synthase
LDDLVTILADEPTTRQAFLPVWFPEDLIAIRDGKRVPCTLGYHFIMRGGQLHIVYYLRSCDFVRHMRDDSYMAIRLLLWVLSQCRLAAPDKEWDKITPGTLTQHMTSLHCFASDPL